MGPTRKPSSLKAAQIAANSGRFALNREIPICAGLRGGPGRTDTNIDISGLFPKCDNSGRIKPQKEFPAAVSPIVIPVTNNKKKSPSSLGESDGPMTDFGVRG